MAASLVSEYNRLPFVSCPLFLSQVVLGRSKNTVQTNLFLKHIISTFGAQLGIIWIGRTDSFYASTTKGTKKIVNTNSLASFLGGYYHSSEIPQQIRTNHNREFG